VPDLPLRVYGPSTLNFGGVSTLLYTCPVGVKKFFIRDITLTNTSASALRVKLAVGDITALATRVYDSDVPANSAVFIRPLWLLDEGETVTGTCTTIAGSSGTGLQSNGITPDATVFSHTSVSPVLNTFYIFVVRTGCASGTAVAAPTVIENIVSGSVQPLEVWTPIASAISTVGSAINVGVQAYYWYNTTNNGNATTFRATYPSTQHSWSGVSFSLSNIYTGAGGLSPIIQASGEADTTAPASTALSKTVTLTSPLTSGMVFYFPVRGGDFATYTPPTGFTEGAGAFGENGVDDISGSLADLGGNNQWVTTPPYTSTTIGPATAASSTTGARAAIAFETMPDKFVNIMVSGIEVR
jgi:hypothetical protein